jgi:methylglutaconyl-CoA hydratase
MNYRFLEIEFNDQVATVWLNRPEVKNALNMEMIEELTSVFSELSEDESLRIIILRGKGSVFCAGGDLNWMKDSIHLDYEQNLEQSQKLADCFRSVYSCRKPVIAMVHGAAMGGANGLYAACDLVLAEVQTVFAFSEVKLGIIPATIFPYILKRTGEFRTKELTLTGKSFSACEAQNFGLVNEVVTNENMDFRLKELCTQILSGGPLAIAKCKDLIHELCNTPAFIEMVNGTAKKIAEIRVTPEAQEGFAAFFGKRKPNWMKTSE